MDISRNIATAAFARSANWNAIRALQAQARAPLRRCLKSLTNHRHLTTTSSLRQAQEFSTSDIPNTHNALSQQPHITRGEEFMRISFRPPKGEINIKSPVRERLRAYERDVLGSARTAVDSLGDQDAKAMKLPSTDIGLIRDEQSDIDENLPLPVFEEGALVDFGDNRSYLLPGDLVEFRSTDNRVELAIFIRQLQTQAQYYTMSGKWLHKTSRKAAFFVPNFVSPQELKPLLAYLPDSDVPQTMQDYLQKFENALPRNIGAPLLAQMRDFQKQADDIYRENASRLDGAYDILCKPQTTRFVTLTYALQVLMPHIPVWGGNRTKESWVKENRAALYAVYRALRDVNVGIRAMPTGNIRAWTKYEVAAKNIKDTTTVTVNIVRLWQKQDSLQRVDSTFGQFIRKARIAIDRSRRNRVPTKSGQVGPSQNTTGPSQTIGQNHWDAHDLIFIRFLLCWAAWTSFHPRSDIASIGCAILRAIGRYDDYILDRSAAWLLLQELGYLKPWDIPTIFRQHIEGYRYSDSFTKSGSGDTRIARSQEEPEIQDIIDNGADTVASLRQDWNDLPAFCIDDPSAHEIDDAISVTKTGTDGEYWVHIHVADPSSMIDPRRSPNLAHRARNRMSNVYLPHKVVTMLPDELVSEKLSLAPGRPTLTFSAKLDSLGKMLDHKITPGFINNVVYLSPTTAAVVSGHSGVSTKRILLQVGNELSEGGSTGGASRHMSSVDELTTSQKDDLKLLASLGAARQKHNRLRGGVNAMGEDLKVDVRIVPELVEEKSKSIRDTKHFLGDPDICFSVSQRTETADIAPLMLLAGEIAAKWCKERNIPIINRVTQKYPGKEDPYRFFKKNILPYYLRDDDPPVSLLTEYMKTIGSVLPSVVPGPHAQLGIEGFSRCTSPLRRYSDMLTHWQIEAALLQEAKIGRSLVGSTDNGYLPFSRKAIETFLPKQDEVDYNARYNARAATKEWVYQALLRAWSFGEGKTKLPETFTFTVLQSEALRIAGAIDDLKVSAILDLPKFVNGHEEIEVGDVFEVRLKTVSTYYGIHVEAVQKLDIVRDRTIGRFSMRL